MRPANGSTEAKSMYHTEDETRITQGCVIPVADGALVVGVVVAGLVGSTARSGRQACARSRSADRGARARPWFARVAWPAAALLALLFATAAATAARASPNIKHITRKAPTTEHTDADRLTWLLEFTEAVTNVDRADFVVTGTTAKLALTPLAVDEEGCSVKWDATLTGGDLAYLNGTVTLAPVADAAITILGCLGDGEIMTHAGPNGTNDNTFVLTNVPPPPPTPPPPPPPGPSAPGAPRNLTAVGRIGQVVLSWEAPEIDGGAAITDYEYRIDRRPPWVSTGSTDTTHTVGGLDSGTIYVFEVRAVNRVGKSSGSNRAEAIPKAPEVLHFSHFANGDGSTSELVFVNVGTQPVRPALYFHDTEGSPIAPESVVDLTRDLEVTEDGGLTVRTGMEPLGELTVSTHGREALVTGSVKVISVGPIGGTLRFDLPHVGQAAVGSSAAASDVIFPVRCRQGGINTGIAIHNLESTEALVDCELLREGVLLDAASFALAANGQASWLIDQAFTAADTSEFSGSVRCTAIGDGQFTAIALEMDSGTRIFATLPVLEVKFPWVQGEATTVNFAHFANGVSILSELVLVNLETRPSGPPISPFHLAIAPTRPVIYFYDPEGEPIAPESVVELMGDLEATEDGGLTVRSEMEPLGRVTVSTHGRGPLVTGSVKVISEGPIGGMLRFDLPHVGEAVVGAGTATGDVIFPVQRQHGGINTAVAIHNLESREALVNCELLREGVPLDAVSIALAANGQTSWSINTAFTVADTSEFSGSVRCTAVGDGQFTAIAVEMDSSTRIFTTLPVVEVEERMSQE